MRATRAGRALVVLLVAVVLGPVALATPAGAHTTLVASEPADRAVAAEAPDTATLVFVNAVDPVSVSLEVADIDGDPVPGVERRTGGGAVDTVEFALPPLDEGVYGLTWQAVGPDGHRVAGEIVVGVGDEEELAATVSEAGGFSAVGGTDRLLDAAAGIARSVWYLAMSVVVGALYVVWWRARRAGPTVAATRTVRELGVGARYWLGVGAGVALVAAMAEWLAVVGVRFRVLDVGGSWFDRGRAAVESAGGFGWTVVVLALVLAVGPVRRVRRADAAGRDPGLDLLTVAVLVVLAATASMLAGHAVSDQLPVLGTASRALHPSPRRSGSVRW
ncbi:MAG: copper resistance protein CopC [Acidimicrobiia bacterium]|nr:copper resistance protein CopC [Acidimicrobiia bacterium]